ncbi:hypothetical protein [Konateibacter massiliensis]|uniref:hypothetical protein n=1 Tax=Konateibacter massiliensis TaxID=2002841 RepID=UPI000C151D12|nr:hypothetical protein [Konateibacter massiliensis]
MNLPALLNYREEKEYKQYYIENYCKASPITTHDGIKVYFYPERFEHSFYKREVASWKAEKSIFDKSRGERMDWIRSVLESPLIIPKQGYDHAKNKYDNTRRVTFITEENYLVVISLDSKGKGRFVTAYIVDNEQAAEKIKCSPDWKK